MKTPYTLNFKEASVIRKFLDIGCCPEWCLNPLTFSQRNVLFETDFYKVFRQTSYHQPFYIELIEILPDKPFDFLFKIQEKQLFLLFMLEGDVEFLTPDNRLITKVKENNFLMSFYDVGKYTASVARGRQIALVVTIEPEWLEKISSDYKNILRIFIEYNKSHRSYLAMYQGKIDRNVHRLIRKVYNSQKKDIGIFDGFLRMHISMMLKHYNGILDSFWIAFDIRDFILDNLTNEDMGLEMLCNHFNLSKRVIRYQFNKIFGENITTFLNNKRMILAKKLMQEDCLMATDVYVLVGYKDESTFRYHFNRFRPSKA